MQAQAVRAVRKMFGSGQYTLKELWVVSLFALGLRV